MSPKNASHGQVRTPLQIGPSTTLGQRTFLTPEELEKWISGEREFYNQIIGERSQSDPSLTEAWAWLKSQYQSPLGIIRKLNTSADNNRAQYQQLLDNFAGGFVQGGLIESKSNVAQFLRELKATDVDLAARTTAILVRAPATFRDTDKIAHWLRAGAIATAWEKGWLDSKPAIDANLESFRENWNQKFDQSVQALNETKASMEGSLEELKKSGAEAKENLNNTSERISGVLAKLDTDNTGALEAAAKTLGDFTSAYNQGLALRAPTQYWSQKRNGHRWAAGLWFFCFVIAAAFVVAGVWYVWHITVEITLKERGDPSYTAFIPSIGAALLGGWFLRMFSRQFISNLALSADAGERVAMVKTYLALTEGGHAKDTDRGLILSSLFRSAVSVSDDGAPPTAADLVSKILKGGGGRA